MDLLLTDNVGVFESVHGVDLLPDVLLEERPLLHDSL